MALLDELLEERGGLEIQARNLIELAESEDRDFTPAEKTTFDAATKKLKSIDARCRRLEAFSGMNTPTQRRSQPTPIPPQNWGKGLREPSNETTGQAVWFDSRTGEHVRSFGPGDKMAPKTPAEMNLPPHPLGCLIRSAITGDRSQLVGELRTMGEGTNWLGGALVPDPIAPFFYDNLRAELFLTRLGAAVVDMPSETLSIAKVATDPTVVVKSENSSFAGTDTNLTSVNLTSQTIGNTITMSRELAMDGINVEQIIEQSLSKALANKLEYWAMQGTGSAQPTGLINYAGINEVSSVGSVTYDDFLDGIKLILDDNAMPNGWVVSPATKTTLAKLKTGDGSTSAAMWLGQPEDLAALERVTTTSMTDTAAIIGNFAEFIIGMRQAPLIEVTSEGGDTFAKHQVAIKVTTRIAFNVVHAESFCKLTGIS